MTPYKSNSGKPSGVTAFRIGKDYIVVQFNHDVVYRYSNLSAGEEIVERMKTLAVKGSGLSTFISREQPGYE